jgi:hypothetical protein
LELLDFEFKIFKISLGESYLTWPTWKILTILYLSYGGDGWNRLLALCQDNIGLVKVITPSCTSPNPFLAKYLIRKNSWRSPTPYLKVTRLEFTWVRIYFDLYDDLMLFAKTTLVWWRLILHLAISCTSPNPSWTNSKKLFSNTQTLFRGRLTRICMSSNLFRPLLHTFLCFLLAYFCLFGHFACVHIMHVPEVVEFEKIIFQHPHPISRSLNSNSYEFEFVTTSIAHIFMLFVGLFLPFWPFCMCAHCVCTPKSHNKLCRLWIIMKCVHPPYLRVTRLKYVRVWIFFEVYCILFWALFWPFLTFLAIFSISSRVTPPKLFWVGKLSPN